MVAEREEMGLADGEAIGLALPPGSVPEIGISGFGVSPERSKPGPPAR